VNRSRITVPGGAEGIKAIQLFVNLANVQRLTILHDEGCPCPDGFPMIRCSCEAIELAIPEGHRPIEIEHKVE
jgi:hypothetical protein